MISFNKSRFVFLTRVSFLFGLMQFAVLFTSCDKQNTKPEASVIAKKQPEIPLAKNAAIDYSTQQLDNTKGLSNSSVNCIFQDSQNLLWIGTWDGLNRYDGSSFKSFRSMQGDAHAISNQVILKIGEDAKGDVWSLTLHGINRYDKKSDTFTQYYFSRKDKPPLSESEFNMALSSSKQVFCAVKEWGIGYFDGSDFRKLQNQPAFTTNVRKMEFSPWGDLLMLYENGDLHSLHISASGKQRAVVSDKRILNGVRNFGIGSNGSWCAVLNDHRMVVFPNQYQKNVVSSTGIDNIVGSVPEGLVLSGKDGYTLIDASGRPKQSAWLSQLKHQKITTLIAGSENIIWTGTDGDGIFKLFPNKKAFQLVSKAEIPQLDGGIVRSFLESGDGSFWVGTKGKGLFKLSSEFYKNQDASPAYTQFTEANSGLDNAVFALCEGRDKLIFIGTDGQGISVYDPEKRKLYAWSDITGYRDGGSFKSVYAIYEDDDGTLWLGTNGYGVIQCRIARGNGGLSISDVRQFRAGTGSLSSNIVFSIVPKNSDQLWIGTRLGGLNLMDKKSGKFTAFKNEPGNTGSLSSNDILCMTQGKDGKLWIGTSYGLNLLESFNDGQNAVFKSFTTSDGLPNNTIHGIVTDGDNLWVSTNFGLSNFVSADDKFINYSRNDGLQNNEFADGAFYRSEASGEVFMGGIKGFNYFLPQKIRGSNVIPDLLIDRIAGQNQAAPYYQGLVISPESSSAPAITLKHDQNFFDIELSAITFTNTEKCQYAYQLKGFDKGWNTIDNRRIISFTNVPRGSYSLYVKWTNGDGVWTNPVQAIGLRIKPVWWQSNVALLIYGILTICFLLFVRSYNLKRQSLKQNILIRENEEILHENRLAFFTNIAHEFLTPLTLIVGPIQKLSENSQLNDRNRKFVNLIQRNTSRLLFLTQQLLEFRKAENDYLEVTVKHFDLVSLVEQIAELFDDWALDKNVTYTLDVPPSLTGWFDKDKLEKIVFNLMSNAFKYTPADGSIHLAFSIEEADATRLKVSISNTGKGIPKEKLESLFDRFFLSDVKETSDTEMFRTGIGLAYIKKLVTVLRGEIEVSSVADELTTFTIYLPCDKDSFTEKEIDFGTSPVLISRHLKNILEEREGDEPDVPVRISNLERLEDRRKKVLVVEDEKEIHSFLNDLLGEKYQMEAAYNGAEALEIMATELPDLIISDVMMPVMDGVDLCKRVKTDLRTCHIPFIMLTAKDSVIHRIEGLESGANSYIPKPFYPDHLLVRIEKLLQEKDMILKHFTQDAPLEAVAAMPVNHEEKDFIRKVIELIRKNIDNENLQSAFIEKELGISNSNLYRKTKQLFGISPGDLIRTLRLKYAAELLRKNVLTVSEVCYKSGFNNRSYFYREFKKMYDTTPKNYQLYYKTRSVSFSNN